MLLIAGLDLSTGIFALLVLCILAVCFFEFVNGFHDTANAVATVIYTHSLKPTQAVVLSGILNFLGVLLGGLGVAWGILKLLPLTELMYAELSVNIAFMLAVLIAAISWNLGTWYFGLPASSSHTLIGALVGASWMFSSLSPEQTKKANDIFVFLFVSPVIGFVGSLLMLSVMRKFIKSKDLYDKPKGQNPPPMWIRLLIILGCVGVSFNHGSNDGQKGVGLLMVVLIAFLPSYFALTPDFNAKECSASLVELQKMVAFVPQQGQTNPLQIELSKLNIDIAKTQELLNAAVVADLPKEKKIELRRQIRNIIPDEVKALTQKAEREELTSKIVIYDATKRKAMLEHVKKFTDYTDFAPVWAILTISLCLGLGTMIGWKRIVETIGEKIGKSGFDYSQGLVSQLVSTITIGLSTLLKLPVSTTHIVSSSIMGTMFAKGGRSNIQRKTITNIFLAWVLTLPVAIGLSATLFWLFMKLAV